MAMSPERVTRLLNVLVPHCAGPCDTCGSTDVSAALTGVGKKVRPVWKCANCGDAWTYPLPEYEP